MEHCSLLKQGRRAYLKSTMQRSSHSMGCLLLLSSVFMLAVGIGTDGHDNGRSPAEDYWQMLLPNSPVPQPILHLTPIDNSATERCLQEAPGAQQSSTKQIPSGSKSTLDSTADKAMPQNNSPYAKTDEVEKHEDKHHKNKPGYLTYAAAKIDEAEKHEDKHHKNKPGYLTYAAAKTDEAEKHEDKHHKNKPGYLTYAAAKTDEAEKHEDKHHKNKPGYLTYAAAKTDEAEKHEDKHHKNKPGYLTYAATKTDEAEKHEDKHHKNKPGYLTYAAAKTDEAEKHEDKHHKNKPGYLTYTAAKTDEAEKHEDKHHKNKPGYLTYAAAKIDEAEKHEDKHHKNKPGYLTYAAAKTDEAEKQEDKHHKNKSGYLTYAAAKTDEAKQHASIGNSHQDKHHKNKPGYLTYAGSEKKSLQEGEEQSQEKERLPVLFLERQLRPGSSLVLDFAPAPASSPAFLRRCAADAMPFSTAKLPEILSTVGRGSAVDADDIASTLEVCEWPVPEDEAASCATSLESLVGFAVSTLGTRDVRAVSSAVPARGAPLQQYNITVVRKIGEANTFVGCHSVAYPYAVFFCHATGAARAYTVSLGGADGVTAVEAVAVCHTDTSRWDPNHVAFQMLHVKRGTVPVCHFFTQNELVWLRN